MSVSISAPRSTSLSNPQCDDWTNERKKKRKIPSNDDGAAPAQRLAHADALYARRARAAHNQARSRTPQSATRSTCARTGCIGDPTLCLAWRFSTAATTRKRRTHWPDLSARVCTSASREPAPARAMSLLVVLSTFLHDVKTQIMQKRTFF